MTSKRFLALASFLLLAGISGKGYAEPITYEFKGTVNSIYHPQDENAAELVDGIVSLNDAVELVFECDQEQDGYLKFSDGRIGYRSDHDNEIEKVDYFLCDYVTGTIAGDEIQPIADPAGIELRFHTETHYGLAVWRKNPDTGVVLQRTSYLYGGPSYAWKSVENYSQNINDWQVAKGNFQFRLQFISSEPHANPDYGQRKVWVRGNLTLTYASNQDPTIAVEDLMDAVEEISTASGLATGLGASLEAAVKVLDDENDKNNAAAINTLNAFINAVEAQRGKTLTDEEANSLIEAALAILASLEQP